MNLNNRVLLVLLLISLAACGSASSNLQYLNSRVVQELELPPDLTQADINADFELPAVFTGTDGDFEDRNKIPVLANVKSIRLEGQSDFYWLSVEEPVSNLYRIIKDFWASEGYTLIMDEPIIGIMQTDWVFIKEGKRQKSLSFMDRPVSANLLAVSQHQFKTRIARDDETGRVKVYISHRGSEYVKKVITDKNYNRSGGSFQFIPPDSELEVEMLSRLMIYLGLRQASVDLQLEKIKLFEPRASLHAYSSEGESYLLIRDVFSIAWNKILHQLDRMDLEVVEFDTSFGFRNRGVIRINTNFEVEDSGFLAFFSSEKKTRKMQVDVIISEETYDTTRISMKSSDKEFKNLSKDIELLTLLYQYIK